MLLNNVNNTILVQKAVMSKVAKCKIDQSPIMQGRTVSSYIIHGF